ncbi:MAG: BolA/IbaG family iron-sulfur metabolism protein [Gammaproteobacteria bacterium]
MNEQEIIDRIKGLYPDADIELAGEDCSFEVYVLSPAFEGMKTLERQRSVLDLFGDEITTGKIHALTVKARTPQEMQGGGGAGLVQLSL